MKNSNESSTWRSFFSNVSESEMANPNYVTVLKLVWGAIKDFFWERPGQILGSAFILVMLWGYHGNLDLLGAVWSAWQPPGSSPLTRPDIWKGIPWDNELISFWAGAFLLVVVPIIIIKAGFKERLSDYGLGLPPKGRRVLALVGFLVLTAISLPPFWFATKHEGMSSTYPLYREFSGISEFVVYQLTYLPFFIAIEFIFRGYLLFGLLGIQDFEVKHAGTGAPGVFYFSRYALLIQMLSYTAWHLGKPLPELWGTLPWGLAAGAVAIAVRSIWPIVLSHWLLNVFMDYLIWSN